MFTAVVAINCLFVKMDLFVENILNFCAFIFLLHFTKETHCLRITRIEVPERAVVGRSVRMQCFFNLDGKQLNSVKWYKNDTEFFRYEPNASKGKKFQYFALPGITINKNETDRGDTVTLQTVTLETSGKYKCEVTTEVDFHTAHLEKEMIVSISNVSSSIRSANKQWVLLFTLLSLITELQ